MPKPDSDKKKAGGLKKAGSGGSDFVLSRTNAKRLQEEETRLKVRDEEKHLSWFSLAGCLGLLKIKCIRRLRRTRQGVAQTIHNEIEATGARKTKTWKTCRRMWRRKGGKGIREQAREWVSSHLATLRSGGKKRKGIKGGNKQRGMFEKEMAAGCFGLASFVIHNDGDVMDFFALDFTKEMGAGGCAHVFKAEERSTHINRAIKRITKRVLPDLSLVANEVSIMKSLDHPNIVKLFETFEDERYFYLVMELCEGGDLLDRLMEVGQFSESAVVVIVRTLLMTLNYLHVNHIVHRDVKPENIMFRENRTDVTTSALRLVDFGFACLGNEDAIMMNTKVGSAYYVAPEILEGGAYDKSCDLWSVGVVAYLLLAGYPPFAGPTDAATLTLVKAGKFVFPHEHWKIIGKNAKHLIKHLLQVDPKKRLSMRKALEHPWIRAKGLPKMEHMKEETVDRLITFHKHHPLRRAAMLAIAYQMEAHDVHILRELFHGLDVNGDGLVQRTEFMKGIQSCGIDETFVQEMIRSVDADGSGIIDYSEFIAATLDRTHYIKNHGVCLRAFRVFDQDDSGMLTKREIAEILDMKDAEQLKEVERFFAEIDANQDGNMDYGEFHAMLQLEIDPNRDALGKPFGEIEAEAEVDEAEENENRPEEDGTAEANRRKSGKKGRNSQQRKSMGRKASTKSLDDGETARSKGSKSGPSDASGSEREQGSEQDSAKAKAEGGASASKLREAADEKERAASPAGSARSSKGSKSPKSQEESKSPKGPSPAEKSPAESEKSDAEGGKKDDSDAEGSGSESSSSDE